MIQKTKIRSLFCIAIIAMIIIMNTAVLAAEANYSAGISLSSSSKLKEGETVTINVKLTSVNAGAGIDALTAGIEYDTNVFETLSTSNFTSSTGWTPTFAASTNKMTGLKSEKITSSENMFTITLKAKSEINVDSTTITLKNAVVSGGIIANGGTGDIKVNNASVTISKEKEATSITEDIETTNTAGNITILNDKTTSNKNIPKTGIEQYVLIALVGIMIVAIFSYAVYKNIAKDIK